MINKNKITITIDKDLDLKIERMVDCYCMNKSKFINRIIKEYLKNYDSNKEYESFDNEK